MLSTQADGLAQSDADEPEKAAEPAKYAIVCKEVCEQHFLACQPMAALCTRPLAGRPCVT